MRKRLAKLLSLLFLLSLTQGCWNYREIDNLMIVAGFAVDRGYEGYKYHLTIDLADTSNAGKDKPVITTLIESEGDTIFYAVNNAIKKVGMQLYWQNCQVAIISQDVATESILPVIDWLNRDAEPRLTVEMFVSEEKTAKEILQTQSATMSITSFEIDKFYELNEKVQPVAEYLQLYEIYNTLADQGSSLVLPSLHTAENVDSKVCDLNGMAIFDHDRLMGFLTTKDSKYVMYVTNHIKGGVLNVEASTGNTIAALEVFANNTKLTPSVENGKLKVQIETSTDAAIDELDTAVDYTDKNKLDEFTFMAESQLAAEIGNTVRMIQSQYGKDVFGFNEALHRSDPDAWYAMRENWDEAFRNAEVSVSCKINIRNTAEGKSAVQKGE